MTCASVAELWVAGMRVFLEVARHEYREKYASSSPILYSAQGRNELRARAKGQTAKTPGCRSASAWSESAVPG
jgi:hypothetical protein